MEAQAKRIDQLEEKVLMLQAAIDLLQENVKFVLEKQASLTEMLIKITLAVFNEPKTERSDKAI